LHEVSCETWFCSVEGSQRERKKGFVMSKKLFVGGLSWGTTDDGLRTAFEEFGPTIDVKVITDRDTGRSRGFGFVTFENAEDAERAKASMNGTELDGRTIAVDEARERSSRPRW
jgi:cold-inducible RNA-binding protein